jgi:hypothetical protein
MTTTPSIVSVGFDDGSTVSVDDDGRYLITFVEAVDVDEQVEAASRALKLFVRATRLSEGGDVAAVAKLVPPADDVPPAAPKPRRAPAAKKTAGAFECDLCPRTAKTERGLAIHKGREHKGTEATPRPPRADDDERLLRCGTDDCLFAVKTTEIAKLRSHVASDHKGFIEGETTPRTSDEITGGGRLMDDLDEWRDKSKFTG